MTTDWVIRDNIRLTVDHFHDGWGWQAWERLTKDEWQALRPPAPQNARRRFMAQHDAEAFFLLLSDFIDPETRTDFVSASPVRRLASPPSSPRLPR